MKKLIIPFVSLFLTFVACQDEIPLPSQTETENFNIDQLKGVEHDIMINILSSRFGGYKKGQPATRATSSFTLTPYVENDDTLLYIAQYADGWEIYSARQNINMVLF